MRSTGQTSGIKCFATGRAFEERSHNALIDAIGLSRARLDLFINALKVPGLASAKSMG